MVVVMAPQATEEDVARVVARVEEVGGEAFVSTGVSRTIIGLVGDIDSFHGLNLRTLPGVADVHRISDPHKLVSRQHHPDRSTVWVGRDKPVPIGPDTFTFIAGPCAVETLDQTLEAARMAKAAGATLLRGGAYKPRTSPYAFQGLGVAGLEILDEARRQTGLPIVTEVVDARDVTMVAEHADMLQVGTRNMANFGLLQAVGDAGRPVLLKRGMTATIEEWLMAAEYIAQRGNLDVVLCERGIRYLRSVHAQHPRHLRDPGRASDQPPADHRRPVARGRAQGPRPPTVSGGDRGGRRRRHRRRPSPPGDRAGRRCAGVGRLGPAGAGPGGPAASRGHGTRRCQPVARRDPWPSGAGPLGST